MFAGDKAEITDFAEGFHPIEAQLTQFIYKAENQGHNDFFKAQDFVRLYQ